MECRASPPGGRARRPSLHQTPLTHAQKPARLLQFRKHFLFSVELARVHTSPTAPQFDWVFQVQHLVEEDVFDGVARDTGVVEDAADDDGVVGRVVVAEAAAGVVLAPGELRTSEESVEEAVVEVVEDFLQMVVVSASGADVLASAHLADEAGLGGNVVTGDVASIAGTVGKIDRLAIEDRKSGGAGRRG